MMTCSGFRWPVAPPLLLNSTPGMVVTSACCICRFRDRRAREYSITAVIEAHLRRKYCQLRFTALAFSRALRSRLRRSFPRLGAALPARYLRALTTFGPSQFVARSAHRSHPAVLAPVGRSNRANRRRALPHQSQQRQSRRRPALLRSREPPAPCSPSYRGRPRGAGVSRHSPATQ